MILCIYQNGDKDCALLSSLTRRGQPFRGRGMGMVGAKQILDSGLGPGKVELNVDLNGKQLPRSPMEYGIRW